MRRWRWEGRMWCYECWRRGWTYYRTCGTVADAEKGTWGIFYFVLQCHPGKQSNHDEGSLKPWKQAFCNEPWEVDVTHLDWSGRSSGKLRRYVDRVGSSGGGAHFFVMCKVWRIRWLAELTKVATSCNENELWGISVHGFLYMSSKNLFRLLKISIILLLLLPLWITPQQLHSPSLDNYMIITS